MNWTVPVVAAESGVAVGLVDVMDLMGATMGDGGSSDGWRSFWEQTVEVDDNGSDSGSVKSSSSSRRDQPMVRQVAAGVPRGAIKLRLPSVMDEQHDEFMSQDLNGMDRSVTSEAHSPEALGRQSSFDALFSFKVQDPNGNLHKVSASAERLEPLVALLADRLKAQPRHLQLKYIDEDGDEVWLARTVGVSEFKGKSCKKMDKRTVLHRDESRSTTFDKDDHAIAVEWLERSASDPHRLTFVPGDGVVCYVNSTELRHIVVGGGVVRRPGGVGGVVTFSRPKEAAAQDWCR